MTKNVKARGRKLGNHSERLDRIENRLDWVISEAFQTLANSVAEQASACQAMLKVLADLHPDRRMVKCATEDGRVFYEFKTLEQIEADAAEMQKAREYVQEVMEAKDNGEEVQQTQS